MEELKNILTQGNHSLVLRTRDGQVLTFDGRGVSDLRNLLSNQKNLLCGAVVADKVVGKAAAALMVLGGVVGLHALLISEGALSLLAKYNVKVEFDQKTDHIINRTNTGWCPMENACRDCTTAEECLVEIEKTIKNITK